MQRQIIRCGYSQIIPCPIHANTTIVQIYLAVIGNSILHISFATRNQAHRIDVATNIHILLIMASNVYFALFAQQTTIIYKNLSFGNYLISYASSIHFNNTTALAINHLLIACCFVDRNNILCLQLHIPSTC